MREYKFRAWDKEDKRMIIHEQEFIPLKITSIGVFRLDASIKEDRWEFINEDRFEIMQYTGLKDKNDKEIYDGDIIKGTHLFVSRFDNQLKKVKMNNGVICFSLYGFKINIDRGEHLYTLSENDEIEIIGNIYENK
jgi:uncharacterized phage protein (TIGR01671 family)